jgi:hypothetical protein
MTLYNKLISGIVEMIAFIPSRVMICLLYNKIDTLLDKLLINKSFVLLVLALLILIHRHLFLAPPLLVEKLFYLWSFPLCLFHYLT